MPSQIAAVFDRAALLENTLRRVIRGKDEVVHLALISMLARGHLLIEGVPGVGKTTLAQAMARALDCTFQRVQFTSDMLPSDVLGISIYSLLEQQFEFKRGPIFTNILLADEINRTTPKTQSALLEAMNEGQVTVDAKSYLLPQPFLVIATQNPAEHHGTYPLPESQLDRFLMRVRMGYPDSAAEREILRSEGGTARLDLLEPVLSGADILEMQQAVNEVQVDESLVNYTLAVVAKTRDLGTVVIGSFSARLSNVVSCRASFRISRRANVLCSGRFQAFNGPSICSPCGRQRATLLTAEKSRTSRERDSRNHGRSSGPALVPRSIRQEYPQIS